MASVVEPIGVYHLDLFYSHMQLYVLLSPYLCLISFLYLDLYLLDDTLITKTSIIRNKGEVGTVKHV